MTKQGRGKKIDRNIEKESKFMNFHIIKNKIELKMKFK